MPSRIRNYVIFSRGVEEKLSTEANNTSVEGLQLLPSIRVQLRIELRAKS